MYSDEEILEHLTEGEGRGFLGRSMYDAIIEKINKKEAMYDSLAVDYRLAQEEIEKLNNIINTMLEFNLFAEECPLNFGYTERCNEEKAQDVFYEDDYCEKTCNDDYKKCWLKYFERLQELKGSDKE